MAAGGTQGRNQILEFVSGLRATAEVHGSAASVNAVAIDPTRTCGDCLEGLGRVERTDGDVYPSGSRSENSAVPVLGFTCGSSSRRLTRARALGKATSKLSIRKNKRRPFPGLA
jgi:hypothetical protein